MDVQPAVPHHWSDVVAPDRPSLDSTNAQEAAATATIDDSEALEDHIKEKRKEKRKEKVE
jgi:hypothetical protein